MAEETENKTTSVRERFRIALNDCAQRVTCVRNDVYTVKYWQFALNFIMGFGAIALLVVSLVVDNSIVRAVGIIAGIALVIATVVFNLVLRSIAPMSYIQYTAFNKDKRYTFQILSKTKSVFSDGENTVAVDIKTATFPAELKFPQYAFDFFVNMDADVRIGKYDRDIYKGYVECNGKKTKCKLVIKNGLPYYATVGGTRIKYFDINEPKEKFVVPSELKDAATDCGMTFPKLAGIYVKD